MIGNAGTRVNELLPGTGMIQVTLQDRVVGQATAALSEIGNNEYEIAVTRDSVDQELGFTIGEDQGSYYVIDIKPRTYFYFYNQQWTKYNNVYRDANQRSHPSLQVDLAPACSELAISCSPLMARMPLMFGLVLPFGALQPSLGSYCL